VKTRPFWIDSRNRAFATRAFHFREVDLQLDRGNDGIGDIVLHREQIVQRSIEALGPLSVPTSRARSHSRDQNF
jgi:hypothetical protein